MRESSLLVTERKGNSSVDKSEIQMCGKVSEKLMMQQ